MKKYSESTKYIFSVALNILLLGLVISLLIDLYTDIGGAFATITTTFLVIAYSYYQFRTNKLETEKRKLNDLKIIAYKEITRDIDILIDFYSKRSILQLNHILDKLKNNTDELNIEIVIYNYKIVNMSLALDSKIKSYEKIFILTLNNNDYSKLQELFIYIVAKFEQVDKFRLKETTIDEFTDKMAEIYKFRNQYFDYIYNKLVIVYK